MDTTVASVGMTDGRLLVTCEGAPSTFVFVGQNGDVRKTVKNVVTADYTFDSADTYIRTVIRSPQTTMYLNPVLRYDGVHVPTPIAVVDAGGTWLLRATCLLAGAAMLVMVRKRKRAPAPAAAEERALPDARRKTA
jgi:hypothetical protein